MINPDPSVVDASHIFSLIHPLATAVVNEQLTFVETSTGFEHMIGLDGQRLYGTPLTDALWEFVGVEENLIAIIKGESERLVLENINRQLPDGTNRYLTFQVIADPGQSPSTTLLLVVEDRTDVGRLQQSLIQDRNELRLARRQLASLNVELKQLNRMKSLYLSIAAHDLRTPLASIHGYAELLRDELADEDLRRKDLFDVILSQSYRLQQLINGLLDLDQVERGEISIIFRECVLNEIISEVVTALRPLSNRAAVPLEVVCPNRPVPLLADPQRLSQILYNLLGNALKFTPAGRHVRLSVMEDKNNVLIDVADDGQGIDQSDIDGLFEPYFARTKLDKQDGKSGTGLGLYIVKLLVDAHNGQISVRSTPGKGTVFSIILPKS